LRALTIEKRPPCFLQACASVRFGKTGCEVAQNAVLRRKLQQPRSIRHLNERGKFLRIRLGRGTFKQERPFVLNRACFEWMQEFS
jgi:hypothetical protein